VFATQNHRNLHVGLDLWLKTPSFAGDDWTSHSQVSFQTLPGFVPSLAVVFAPAKANEGPLNAPVFAVASTLFGKCKAFQQFLPEFNMAGNLQERYPTVNSHSYGKWSIYRWITHQNMICLWRAFKHTSACRLDSHQRDPVCPDIKRSQDISRNSEKECKKSDFVAWWCDIFSWWCDIFSKMTWKQLKWTCQTSTVNLPNQHRPSQIPIQLKGPTYHGQS